MKRTRFILSIVVLILLSGCEPPPTNSKAKNQGLMTTTRNQKLSILTVNYPLQYFAQRIGSELVDALYPGPADADPAFWQPDIDTVVAYQQSDLIILNGAGYAGWVKKVSLPLARQVDPSAGFAKSLLPAADNVAHTHGPTGEHVHDDLAFTVWLDPQLAGLQADTIYAALVKQLPEHQDTLSSNLMALKGELAALDTELAQVFAGRNGRQIIYSHPVYQYLDRRYEIDGMTLHWEPNELPTDGQFAKLKSNSGALMIWEAEPLEATRIRLEAMGITSVVFDTAATKPQSGDYLDVMRTNLQSMQNALR